MQAERKTSWNAIDYVRIVPSAGLTDQDVNDV